MKKYIIVIAAVLLVVSLSFYQYKNSTYFATKDEAIQHHLDSVSIPGTEAYLAHIVETNIPDKYYLLIKSNGSDKISMISSVDIKKNIFGWSLKYSDVQAEADFSKYYDEFY